MTNEEAISWLNKAKGNAEALRMAKEALERQIPKKPIEDGYYNLPCVCPTCGIQLDSYFFYNKYDFCESCGQAIDWSDE